METQTILITGYAATRKFSRRLDVTFNSPLQTSLITRESEEPGAAVLIGKHRLFDELSLVIEQYKKMKTFFLEKTLFLHHNF